MARLVVLMDSIRPTVRRVTEMLAAPAIRNINAMLKGPLPADLYEEAKRRLPREDLVPAAPPRAR